ncbi:phospholipase D-like domain-containing protein [Echinicola shivajiensis]|uniref:phospholipase D-like domain-containing protein n=1 Tax=Echinicola shivajiensis TaxID=1035916 RepID=UPI001BFC84D3|nr:phospholipase D-like domain-containing protein [Echinicola shivajiensis]
MPTLENIIQEFKSSLEDHVLSRSEKKAIKSDLSHLSTHEKQLLLSEIRHLALENTQDVQVQNLIQWFYEAVKVLQQKEQENSTTAAYFSPGNACRDAIKQEIRNASSLIHICVFTISDDHITEELLHAHQRKVPIKIITDDDKSFDLGSDIDRMEKAGILIQKDNSPVHMHHKFAIFDQKKVLTGSYNWTRSAAEYNYENIVLLEDTHTVRSFQKEFEKLWRQF